MMTGIQHSNKEGYVAIIGMACIFPQAPDLRTFWRNIVSKVDAIGDPPAYWMAERFYDPASKENDRIYSKRGGYLGDLARFDPLKYGIMPVAVDGAEPEHFLSLRVAHEALTDAGIPERPLNRERTAVILGRGTFVNRGYITLLQHGLIVDQTLDVLAALHPEYSQDELAAIKKELKASLPPFHAETAPGLAHSVMAGLIANRLDLKGPNFVIDAACASCLIALEIGINDLLTGRCDAVLTGGVQISTPSPIHMLFTQLGALSRHPQLRPFDRSADGTMLGEGIGMVVLKRLDDAVRDGHRIYAVVRGVGSASDGKAKGVLAPRAEGEELALRRAYENAGLSPQTIGLIEAHGTGIPLGDATEMQTLKSVFGAGNGAASRCAVGTVKSMIGHLIPAAGIAGIIKTSLALYHKILPPTLHCDQPNPAFGLEQTPLYINTETRPWIHGVPDVPRRAGVNSFGFGGINAHAILEEYATDAASDGGLYHDTWDSELVVLSGESRDELLKSGSRLHTFLAAAPDAALKDVAYTVNSMVEGKRFRLAIVGASVADLDRKLNHALTKLQSSACRKIKDKSGIYFFEEPLAAQGKLAFIFPGEGSQYLNMLADLCIHFPEVRRCFDILDAAFTGHKRNYLPSSVIYPPPRGRKAERGAQEEGIFRMEGAVDAVITADRALYRLMQNLHIKPDVMLGHSSGEFMSLEAAGAITYGDESELIDHIRAGNQVIEQITTSDRIPSLPLHAVGGIDQARAVRILEAGKGRVFIAMENCPNQFVLCGDDAATAPILREFQAMGGICQTLPFARPYHSPLFRPAQGFLQDYFTSLKVYPPAVPLYSCMTASIMPPDPAEIRRLAVEQWSNKVRFRETVESMYRDGVRIFVEVGPRANLTGFISDTLNGRPFLAVASNVHHRTGITQLHHALGMLAAHGVSLSLDYLYRRRAPVLLDLDASRSTAPGGRKTVPELSLALPLLRVKQRMQRKQERPVEDRAPVTHKDPGSAIELPPMPADALRYHGGRSAHQQTEIRTTARPTGTRETALHDYLQTMEHFLHSQKTVMHAYLSRRSAVKQERTGAAPMPGPAGGARFPFPVSIEHEVPGREISLNCTIDRDQASFLNDHTLGGRVSRSDPSLLALPVMPFSMSLEIMAETASRLFPRKRCIGMRDVKAQGWITVEDGPVTLQVTARTAGSPLSADSVSVQMSVRSGADARIVAEGTIVFGDAYPAPAAVGEFRLSSERSLDAFPAVLYPETLFHGPSLRSVETVTRIGDDGIETALMIPPRDALFASCPDPVLAAEPVVLDAVGQAVGIWASRMLDRGFVIFPFGIEELVFFTPPVGTTGHLMSRVNVAVEGDAGIRSDALVYDRDGKPRMRVRGLKHKRIDMPRIFHLFRGSREVLLSTTCAPLVNRLPAGGAVECRRFDLIPFPFWNTDQGVWQSVLAHIILSRTERRAWCTLQGTNKRRMEWLLGRAVGKETVRVLVKRLTGIDLWPADIEINADEQGKPLVAILHPGYAGPVPLLSLTHKNGIAVALAADGSRYSGLGVDMEHLRSLEEGFTKLAFSPGEQSLLAGRQELDQTEWTLRLWCAKEATAKVLGRGLVEAIRDIRAEEIDPEKGTIRLSLSGSLAQQFPQVAKGLLETYTVRDGDYLLACGLHAIGAKGDSYGATGGAE